MKVIEDMTSVAGCAPAKVYVEVTRTASEQVEGQEVAKPRPGDRGRSKGA